MREAFHILESRITNRGPEMTSGSSHLLMKIAVLTSRLILWDKIGTIRTYKMESER